jgi:hypothetical protein
LSRRPELRLRSLHKLKPTLEEVFMAATRRSWEALIPTPREGQDRAPRN